MYTKITSFKQIEITDKKTLIICDIDDTILKYKKPLSFFYDIIHKLEPDSDVKSKNNEAYNFYHQYKITLYDDIEHTDYDGYNEMLKKLNPESGLIFLTARSVTSDVCTRQQLKILDIDETQKDIYYTGKEITKGEFMEKYMDLSEYKNMIFIDDSKQQILSVISKFPNITAYLFSK